MLGKHLAKGQSKPAAGAGRRSPNLVYHNGPVLTNGAVVRAIFWGPDLDLNRYHIARSQHVLFECRRHGVSWQ